MSTPDPAHIDAIMDEVAMLQSVGPLLARRIADGILGSQNPAVHAAMLDALTRHGVLTEEWRGGGIRTTSREDAEEFREAFTPSGRPVEHRIGTRWEAVA